MNKGFTIADIDEKIAAKIYTQSYTSKKMIEGVMLIPLKNHVGEDGSLTEVIKVSEKRDREKFPDFNIAQVNSSTLFPGTIKGWHVHFKQNDLWYVLPSGHLIVCLWDIRKSSSTNGAVMRFALGGGNAQLLFIPQGVAHGATNITQKDVDLLYFTDQIFDSSNPDEKRIPWNTLGDDFWTPRKD